MSNNRISLFLLVTAFVWIASENAFGVTIVSRSIGTQTSVVYSATGNASTNSAKDTISLSSGTFPDSIGEGDSIRIGSTPQTGFILARVNATKIALQSALTNSETNANISMYRGYNSLSSWESACPSNLITSDKIWKGVCYKDGAFASGVNIYGITTDSTHYPWLTVAKGQRHTGKQGTGAKVVISGSDQVHVQVNNVLIEWLGFTGTTTADHFIVLGDWGTGSNTVFRNCLIYDVTCAYSGAITIGTNGVVSNMHVENCIVSNSNRHGSFLIGSLLKCYFNRV